VDIQFYEPEEAARSPHEVAFRRFQAEPLEGGRRVRLSLSITPFQQRPSIEIELFDPNQRAVARTSIVEATDVNMSLTMHLRGEVNQGEYTAEARLFYPPNPPVDQAQALFRLPATPPAE
jgi:hypothetical protein